MKADISISLDFYFALYYTMTFWNAWRTIPSIEQTNETCGKVHVRFGKLHSPVFFCPGGSVDTSRTSYALYWTLARVPQLLERRTDESINVAAFWEMFAQTSKSNNYVSRPKLSGAWDTMFSVSAGCTWRKKSNVSPRVRENMTLRDHESRVGVAWGRWIWLNHGRP